MGVSLNGGPNIGPKILYIGLIIDRDPQKGTHTVGTPRVGTGVLVSNGKGLHIGWPQNTGQLRSMCFRNTRLFCA